MNPITQEVDSIFLFIMGISVLLLVFVTVAMIYFMIRYRAKRNPKSSNITGNTTLEVVWTVIPLFLVMIMFFYGWDGFEKMRTVPSDAMVIKVTGRMWSWSYEYPNGKKSDTVLYVPVGQPIKAEIQSNDVNHSFFLPAFRVKEDAIPGRTNYLWFWPNVEGDYVITCAEYCGMNHAYMQGTLKVVSREKYNEWVNKIDSVKKTDSTTTGLKTDSLKIKTDSVKTAPPTDTKKDSSKTPNNPMKKDSVKSTQPKDSLSRKKNR